MSQTQFPENQAIQNFFDSQIVFDFNNIDFNTEMEPDWVEPLINIESSDSTITSSQLSSQTPAQNAEPGSVDTLSIYKCGLDEKIGDKNASYS